MGKIGRNTIFNSITNAEVHDTNLMDPSKKRYVLLESVIHLALHPLLELATPDFSGQHSVNLEYVFS